MIARVRYRRFAGRAARHAVLMLTAAFSLLPFVWMVSLSLKPPEEIFQADFHLWPTAFHGVENYRARADSGADVPLPAERAAGVRGDLRAAAPGLHSLCLCAREATLSRQGHVVLGGAGRPVAAAQALAIPHFVLLHVFGLLDTYAALILPWAISTFGIFLLRQFFRSIPDEIIHAARLDGLGEFEIIWRIMIPMTVPALAAFGIFSVVAHWNDLFWPLIAVRSAEISTPALGILLFRDDEAGQFLGPLMAGAVIIVAPLAPCIPDRAAPVHRRPRRNDHEVIPNGDRPCLIKS